LLSIFLFLFLFLFFSKQQDFTQHKRKRKLGKYNFGFPSQPELMGDSAAFIFVWSCDPVMFRFLRSSFWQYFHLQNSTEIFSQKIPCLFAKFDNFF
jgi:hypothetical protein